MATYTTELRTLIENGFDIGLTSYPIFDETYRQTLNAKIIEHYFFREIGFETAELFKRVINRTMHEIMPYYNQLYNSQLIEFDPMQNFDKTEEHKRGTNTNTKFDGWANDSETENGKTVNSGRQTGKTNTATTDTAHGTNVTTGTITTVNNDINVDSDTPQGMLSIGDIKNNTFASSAKMADGTTRVTYDENGKNFTVTTDSTDTANGVTDTLQQTENTTTLENSRAAEGKSGTNTEQKQNEWITAHFYGKSEGVSYSEMLLKFRETFINIDMQIIDELETCFMQIF